MLATWLKQEVTQTLSRCITRWEAITSSREVLNVIREGHEIPFETTPPPFSGILDSVPPDPQGALVLRRELEEMLSKGAVTRVTGPEKHDGYYSHYFLVPKRDGGSRPILNLKPLKAVCEEVQFQVNQDGHPALHGETLGFYDVD